MNTTDHDSSRDALDASARQFMLWVLGAFDLQLRSDDSGIYEIVVPQSADADETPPPHPLAEMNGRRFSFDPPATGQDEAPSAVEYANWDSPIVKRLLEELQQGAKVLQAVAADQPASVHELTNHLFAQYQVDDGHMRLAGCSLEDRPFLRLSYLQRNPGNGEPQLVHCFGDSEGHLVEVSLRQSLELDNLSPILGRAPKMEDDLVRRWSDVTRQQFSGEHGDRQLTLIAATLVWCKHAEGKLALTIGSQTVEVAFTGWGRMLADRSQLPPPYTCPESGRSSYHLAATDDGRVTVAEAIGTCAESSRRVLQDELQTCSVTGRHVLPEYLSVCPCTDASVLATILEPCSMCQQPVSPRAVDHGRCQACHRLQAVSKDDSRLERVLDRYPKLRQFRNYKIAETSSVLIVTCASTWKRLLVVLDKSAIEVQHLATGRPFSSHWTEVAESDRDRWLGAVS